MASNLITVSGGKSFNKSIVSLEKLDTNIADAVVNALRLSAELTKRKLKDNTPVDTGNLKRSVEILSENFKKGEIVVGPAPDQAPYAKWVEYGHHLRNGEFLPGQFFIQKTTNEVSDNIQQFFKDALAKAIDKAY